MPYGCMVDEFQHRIYDNPELTPDERKAVWKELEQIYKPHQDYGALAFYAKGCYWQRQHHIYSYPFYYIDYVIAQLCAFEYKNKMDEDYKEAWQSYLKLCRLSASDYFENLLKAAGIRSPFEEGCMKEIVDKLKKKINQKKDKIQNKKRIPQMRFFDKFKKEGRVSCFGSPCVYEKN